MEKLPTFECLIKDGIYGIVLTANPASNDEEPILLSDFRELENRDSVAKTITAVTLRPNVLIYRGATDNLPARNIFFSPKTVVELSKQYLRDTAKIGVAVEHGGEKANDCYCIESWIVADENNDKSNALGLNAKNGDLVQTFQISDNLWGDVESGKLKGFSAELSMQQNILLSNELLIKTKNKMSVKKMISDFLLKLSDAMPDEEVKPATEEVVEEEMAEEPTPPAEEPATDEPSELEKAQARVAELEIQVSDLTEKLMKAENDKVELSKVIPNQQRQVVPTIERKPSRGELFRASRPID